MLSSKWGQLKQAPFPFAAPAVDVDYDTASGKYIYRKLREDSPLRVDAFASVWRGSIGLMYDF
jgi:hypothetical protein